MSDHTQDVNRTIIERQQGADMMERAARLAIDAHKAGVRDDEVVKAVIKWFMKDFTDDDD